MESKYECRVLNRLIFAYKWLKNATKICLVAEYAKLAGAILGFGPLLLPFTQLGPLNEHLFGNIIHKLYNLL
jgi:hypothetical protein